MASSKIVAFDDTTTANAALNVACGTTGANVLVNAQGYTAP